VQVRESNGKIHSLLLEEYTTAEDFTSRFQENYDDQLWFTNRMGSWSIVTEDTWDNLAEQAEAYMLGDRTLPVIALTKEEWEMDPEDSEAIVERYLDQMRFESNSVISGE
jgi:hypothetical protein